MFIIVSYDIGDEKRRNKIAKILEDYGNRVQYSVFECLLDEIKFKEMLDTLVRTIEDKDNLKVYLLCEACTKRIKVFGSAKITEDKEVYII